VTVPRRTGRALVIGVPKPGWGDGIFPELEGVPVDVAGMAEMLSGRGYDVTIPHGPGALRTDRLEASLLQLVDATEDGDEGLIYLTGHGYERADTSGDEKWDEAFVTENGLILDDWFRDCLWPTAKPGSRFVVIVDACHSESLTVYVDVPPLPPPAVVQALPAARYRLTLSACPDEADAMDGGPKIGSIVTGVMLRALQATPDQTYRGLWTEVANAAARENDGIATPQILSLGPDDGLVNSLAFGRTA
jgi:hypothetical protein